MEKPIKIVYVEDIIINGEKTKHIKRIDEMCINIKLDVGDIILIDDILYTIRNATISIDTNNSSALEALILEKTTFEEFEDSKYSNSIRIMED